MDISQLIETERQAVVEEARTWLNTPYMHRGSIKRVGVDCAMILKEVYGKIFPELNNLRIANYPPDWHLHRDDERYLGIVRQYAEPTDDPKPGDIVVVHFGRAYGHGGIVVNWPICIHSYLNARAVVLEDFVANKELDGRKRLFFSPWLKRYGRTE